MVTHRVWGLGESAKLFNIIINSLDNLKRREKVPIRQVRFETVSLSSVIIKSNNTSFYNSPVCRKKE